MMFKKSGYCRKLTITLMHVNTLSETFFPFSSFYPSVCAPVQADPESARVLSLHVLPRETCHASCSAAYAFRNVHPYVKVLMCKFLSIMFSTPFVPSIRCCGVFAAHFPTDHSLMRLSFRSHDQMTSFFICSAVCTFTAHANNPDLHLLSP